MEEKNLFLLLLCIWYQIFELQTEIVKTQQPRNNNWTRPLEICNDMQLSLKKSVMFIKEIKKYQTKMTFLSKDRRNFQSSKCFLETPH